MKTGNNRSLSILLAAIVMMGGFSAEAATKKTLRVGIILRLNDKFNDTVSAMTTGIETAKALYERKHPGVKIELKHYPHSNDLESVMKAANQSIADKVPAVIGGELSEEAFVIGDRLGESKSVFITPTSSNPKVTEGKPYAFRACFSDRLVASQLAHYMVDILKPKSIGLLHNVSSPYTDFLSKQFMETHAEIMAKFPPDRRVPLHQEKVLRDTPDFGKQIDAFMEKGVTHIAMLTHQSDLLKFALQAANKGFFPVYLGSDGWGSNEHVHKNLVIESPHGSKFSAFRNSYWKQDAQTPMAKDFRETYEGMHTRKPTAWSAISFDAAWILFTAMDRAKKPSDGEEIRKQMTQIKKLHLVTADQFAFGPDNSPRKDLYIYRLDKSGINYEATLR